MKTEDLYGKTNPRSFNNLFFILCVVDAKVNNDSKLMNWTTYKYFKRK